MHVNCVNGLLLLNIGVAYTGTEALHVKFNHTITVFFNDYD